ncbi:hypothetical protein TNCV_4419321 [Trichonephila clavipes]|nr:hypothetical protein TNCV_4419321 [Trichonephila clavipes]
MLIHDSPKMYEIVKDYVKEEQFLRPRTSHDPEFEAHDLNEPHRLNQAELSDLIKLECLRAKQNTFFTSSQVPQFEETKYLIDTDKNSEQMELDREEEKEVNSENKEILPPVGPCSHISPVTKRKIQVPYFLNSKTVKNLPL